MSSYDDSTHVSNPTAPKHEIQFKIHVRRPASPDIPFDFDDASIAWMANKVRRGESVCYQCTAIKKDGHPCSKAILSHYADNPFLCKTHRRFVLASPPPEPLQTESHSATATARAIAVQ